MFKLYALYRTKTNTLVDVIREGDIGSAAQWFIAEGYNNTHTVRPISIKTLRVIKRRLIRQSLTIYQTIANISRYI